MDNIKKDVSLYDMALNANWPSTEDKAFDESVFDLASQTPQDSIEQEEKLPTADKRAENYFTEHNHIFFPDLLQVTLTKEDVLADQVKVQVRVQMGARTQDADVVGEGTAANATPGHTEPPAAKRVCIEADKSHSYQAMMQILGG